MSLQDYYKKRDFKDTPEPKGKIDKENASRFVVQRHKASHLHYDLRLEINGVLKSWAVPKGPSMNPKDKRLAIQTEDHPVAYLDFQGKIPKGNYGAGVMNIWDSGKFQLAKKFDEKEILDQLEAGDLKLTFFGKKLKGDFALVRTKRGDQQNQWLLIKKKDEYHTELNYDAEDYITQNSEKASIVKELSLKTSIKPMLASATKEIFNDPKWIYELKWDGYRVITNIVDGKVNLYSRNGISLNKKFPSLRKDLEQIPHNVILDGEVVVVDKNGVSDFQKLQNYSEDTKGELRYYVFDMLFLNDLSMLELPLLQRKSLIPEVLEDSGVTYTFYCDHIVGMGTTFYKRAVDAGMEGVIAKKADSTYTPGYRTTNWLKIKAIDSQEAIICGYTNSEGSLFGSLILGIQVEGELKYIGNCGSGFSAKEQTNLLAKFKSLQIENSPFQNKINLKGRKPNWIKPELICEVKFSEWTKSGVMRHPIYKGLRNDKNLDEISKEQIVEEPKSKKISKSSSSSFLELDGYKVPITNLEKVFWPESGIRKYDLIDYYLNIAEIILPYLKDRPQNLHRHPNGINKKSFYQKDNQGLLPDWVETVELHSKSADKDIEYLLCQNTASLLYMANLGCIEINPWSSKIQNLDNPDYTVIDLDPSEKNSFEEVIEVAQVAKEILDKAGIAGYCKTSGSSGLHIYIPLAGNYRYEEARDFTKLLCYFINERIPKLTSMERVIKNRKNKIYLDYLQNKKGQTLASAYCTRPKPGATVSAPLFWDEVKSGLRIIDFNIQSMPNRIQEKGDLFLGVLGDGINMEKALEKLNL